MKRTKLPIAIILIACILPGNTAVSASSEMIFPGEHWQEASPESQGVDSTKLEAAVSYLKDHSGSDGVKELVIIRNGRLIWKGSDIDKKHGVWSLTKSFTSTTLGLLIDDGKATLDTRAKDYISAMATVYPDVTLRHFTTMTSGYYAIGDEPRGTYRHGPSRTPFKPGAKPLFEPPGSHYAYWDSAMNQFANVLTRIADEPIEEMFKRRIADPIGMDRSKWDWGDFGKVEGLIVNGGSGNNSKHMFISARELARFGLLFLNRGKWNDKQLISAEWIDMATRSQVPLSISLGKFSAGDGRGTYGFNWWVNGIKPNGERKWPDAPVGTYSASGYNNNDMFIIPEWNMVIVRLGLDQRDVPIDDATYNSFLKKIGEAIEQKPGRAMLEKIGVTGGICVLLGENTGELAIELARSSDLLIYVQSSKEQNVETIRKAADAVNLYGTRIFVDKGPTAKLNLADNVADVVIASDGMRNISRTEVLRVLRPQGKALLDSDIIVKPFPPGVDDWSHPYHGPDNNPQSNDKVVRSPHLTQFLAEPRYAPLPQVAVASTGRIFKAFGHVAFKTREEPLLNKLVAFNGYNGTILWQRDLTEGVMIHRNTMIATPTRLYIGDDTSCKVIDTSTGQLIDEIIPPVDVAGGTFWKWMGIEGDVLYALTGEQEQRDPTMRWRRERHGWPWNPISKGFNQPDGIKDSEKAYLAHPWGFGRNVLAIDLKTKRILWDYHEREPIDGRAMCMKNGRLYVFRFGAYLTCLNAKTGKILWRKTPDNAPGLFAAIGQYSNRQGASWNWRTTCYLKCSEDAVYFAGPQVGKLVAVSAMNGELLWIHPYNNFQLVLRDEGLYAIAGQNDRGHLSRMFNPLTGNILAEFETGRRACTRPNGAYDAIFYRARGGSTRFDLASGQPQLVSPMRAQCHDGVTIANGLLYWWPSVCDCQLTLYGITCLGPAGDFDFKPSDSEAERRETGNGNLTNVSALPQSSDDWPTFRADNACSASTSVTLPESANLLWQYEPKAMKVRPTAPVTVGNLVFTGGAEGIVRAVDAINGNLRWKAYTGGGVRIAPTIWNGRCYVGSDDGWIYAFEAQTGRLLWRFRAAPIERKIPVYGKLLSTWPAASGVLVEDGIAYVAAGIVDYDGTYVYALDAVTGRIKWRNETSGHLNPQSRCGVSVQGHLLLNNDKLYLAGGNAVSPAVYDATNGRCLNDPDEVQRITQNNVLLTYSPRGWELSLLADHVVACGQPFYAHPDYEVFDPTVFNRVFLSPGASRDIVWTSYQNNKRIFCFDRIDRRTLNRNLSKPQNQFLVDWKKLGTRDKPLWTYDCRESVAIAVCGNAVVIAETSKIFALSIDNGKVLWSCPLPAHPVEWGLAIDRRGRAVVSLRDGRILCFDGSS